MDCLSQHEPNGFIYIYITIMKSLKSHVSLDKEGNTIDSCWYASWELIHHSWWMTWTKGSDVERPLMNPESLFYIYIYIYILYIYIYIYEVSYNN